jgi:hypothetical protein
MFSSEDELLDSIQREYKHCKGILDFDAAYALPEQAGDLNSIGKQGLNDESISEALVKRIWEVTHRRWT